MLQASGLGSTDTFVDCPAVFRSRRRICTAAHSPAYNCRWRVSVVCMCWRPLRAPRCCPLSLAYEEAEMGTMAAACWPQIEAAKERVGQVSQGREPPAQLYVGCYVGKGGSFMGTDRHVPPTYVLVTWAVMLCWHNTPNGAYAPLRGCRPSMARSPLAGTTTTMSPHHQHLGK
jgi:hypothetical protein